MGVTFSASPVTESGQSGCSLVTEITAMTIVSRSVVAGVCGGLVAALFVALVGEDTIGAAIALEDGAAAGVIDEDSGSASQVLFSRSTQFVGGVLAAIIYGVVTGIVFGTVFAAVRHRLDLASDFARSVLLAAGAFAATAFIPAMKYPANPPAVGNPDTVGQRTISYLTLVAASMVLMYAIGLVYRQLRFRIDAPSAISLSFVGGGIGLAVLMIVWPESPDRVPAEFPAQLLWRFRVDSLVTLALSWATVGLVLGWLLTRTPSPGTRRPQALD